MKKMLTLFFAALLLLALAACGETAAPEPEPEPAAETEIDHSQVEAMASFHPDFDLDQAQAMNNFDFDGMALVEDGVFYGRFFVKGMDYWQFVKMELIPDPENENYITSGEWSILDDDVVPQYVNKAGDTLYYIAQDWTKGDEPVCSLCSVSADGQDQTKLADGSGFLTVRGDRLYFTDADNRYVSTDLSGGDKQVILDKEVYYPYFLDEDWILYQDDADNESLHLYHVPDGVDVKINDEKSYGPFLYGSCLYYTSPSAENEAADNVCRVDLADWTAVTDEDAAKEIPVFNVERSENLCGGQIHISSNGYLKGMNNANGVSMDYWYDFADDGYETWEEDYIYVSQPVDIYEEYDVEQEDNPLKGIYFMNNETNYGQTIIRLR